MWEDKLSNTKIVELLRSFRQVERSLHRLMRMQAADLHITPVQLMVLRVLYEEPDLSLSELANELEVGCSTASGVVQRLVTAGILERERLQQDQRTIAVRLTEKGRQLEKLAFGDDSLMSQALQKLLQIPEQNIDALLELHGQLLDILNHEGANANRE